MARAEQWLVIAILLFLHATLASADDWVTNGGTTDNRRWARNEKILSEASAPSMRLKWSINTRGDVGHTPAIYKGVVYFNDREGYVYAVRQQTGEIIWERTMSSYVSFNQKPLRYNVSLARSTPVIAGNLLILHLWGPAYVLAVKRATGDLVWVTRVDDHPAAVPTGAGSFYKGAYYLGVSSQEETSAIDSSYPCCTFIGSFVKLSIRTGQMIWKTRMLPDNGGRPDQYAGAAIWAATPAIDGRLGLVFTATGNAYKVPESVRQCQIAWVNANNTAKVNTCLPSNVHQDSLLAINMATGAVVWSKRFTEIDTWNAACIFRTLLRLPGYVNCLDIVGPDVDFGMNPSLTKIKPFGYSVPVDVLLIGQKTGVVYCVRRDNGAVIWSNKVGPGGEVGGVSWGLAVDDQRVYLGNINSNNEPYVLQPSKKVTRGGFWAALDVNTGRLLWSVANPWATQHNRSSWALPPAVANGVLAVSSPDTTGHVHLLSAATGRILFTYRTGQSAFGTPAIDKGCIYFGQGYWFWNFFFNMTGNGPQRFYALCVPPRPKLPPKNGKGIAYWFRKPPLF